MTHDSFSVSEDVLKAFEQQASFYKTYLRRKRLKHSAEVRPVRRDGASRTLHRQSRHHP